MFKRRFDSTWYLKNNPDVADSGMTAREHYLKMGHVEGRSPCPPGTPVGNKLERLIFGLAAAPRLYGGALPATRFMLGTLRQKGWRGLKTLISDMYNRSEGVEFATDYPAWQLSNELTANDRELAQQLLSQLPLQPLISVLLPTYNSNITWLQEAIDSLKTQPYRNWELCIADDASNSAELIAFLQNLCAEDSRIKLVLREHNGHISAASNSAAQLASGEWIALFDHDDLLHPFAFYWVLQAINHCPEAQLIYSDEDKINTDGYRHSPYFKPDWNYDLFLSQNCFSHLGLIKASLFKTIGGFRIGLEGSQDHDLVLRALEHVNPAQIVHIPKVLYHWRVHAQSTAGSARSKPYAAVAGERAISEHLQHKGINAQVSYQGYGYRVQYPLPVTAPLVSLIIPTRNGLQLLRQCIDSIVEKTTYQNYEFIIVDNGSDDTETLAYLESLKNQEQFTIIRDDRPFNYSQLNNLAAREAKGEILGLINNDIEVIAPEWLSEMVSHALRPEIGAVGAKLLFPDDSIQHGGVILGVGGVANHAHLKFPAEHPGYFGRLSLTQEFSAVTAACLLVRKAVYLEAIGLNERQLKVAFNDVDFCLRLRKLGYRNLWTPYALLYHHESATRGQDLSPEKRARFVSEVEYMMATWSDIFPNDPAYNPNLNIRVPDFTLDKLPRLSRWDLMYGVTTATQTSNAQL